MTLDSPPSHQALAKAELELCEAHNESALAERENRELRQQVVAVVAGMGSQKEQRAQELEALPNRYTPAVPPRFPPFLRRFKSQNPINPRRRRPTPS